MLLVEHEYFYMLCCFALIGHIPRDSCNLASLYFIYLETRNLVLTDFNILGKSLFSCGLAMEGNKQSLINL